MNKYKTLLALASLLAVTTSASAGVKEIGSVNGLRVVRIKTAGVFCPSTTTIVYYDPNKPGTIEGVLNSAAGPGFIPAAANAGGLAGAAALLRPARSETNVSASSGGATASGSGNATGGGSQKVPPGHVNNPSGNH
jgi:hypothetical protein